MGIKDRSLTSGGGWGGTMSVGSWAPQFGPGWTTSKSGNYLFETNTSTTVKNASATVTWPDGTTNFGLVATMGPKGGLMAIYLAGKKVATVNMYAAKTVNRVVVWGSEHGNTDIYSGPLSHDQGSEREHLGDAQPDQHQRN